MQDLPNSSSLFGPYAGDPLDVSTLTVHHSSGIYAITYLEEPAALDFKVKHALAGTARGPPASIDITCLAGFVIPDLTTPADSAEMVTYFKIVHLVTRDPPSGEKPFFVASLLVSANKRQLQAWIAAHPLLAQTSVDPSSALTRQIACVVNPASGGRAAASFFINVLGPLLQAFGVDYYAHFTNRPGDGERVGREILENFEKSKRRGGINHVPDVRLTVAILGGDGTVHEFINGFLAGQFARPRAAREQLNLIITPLGTANALFHHLFPDSSTLNTQTHPHVQLLSIFSYLRGAALRGCPISTNVIAADGVPEPPIYTSVVTSAALHAAILYDAEKLRDQYVGVERFKVAAQQNATLWVDGELTLVPGGSGDAKDTGGANAGEAGAAITANPATSSTDPTPRARAPVASGPSAESGVLRYNPQTKTFNRVASDHSGRLTLSGPFTYLVATLCSRFEPTFVIAPLRSNTSILPPCDEPSFDVIVIRPLRDKETQALYNVDEAKAREAFVPKIWDALTKAYAEGAHIEDYYDPYDGAGKVEYYRCSSMEWSPRVKDVKSSLVCLDGALLEIPQGGKLTTTVISIEESDIRVWG